MLAFIFSKGKSAEKRRTYSLLIQEMGNQTNRTTQDEETVEDTNRQVLFSFLSGERATFSEQVNKADSNTPIHVQDQVVLLGSCDSLNGNGVVKKLVRREVLDDKVLDEFDT